MSDFLEIMSNATGYSQKSFLAGDIILSPLDEELYFYILLEGRATVYYDGPNGELMMMYNYEPVNFFGEVEILSDKKNPFLIIAKTDCTVRMIRSDSLVEYMKNNFEFTKFIIASMCDKMLASSDERVKITMLTLKERYIITLWRYVTQKKLHELTKDMLTEQIFAPIRSLNRVVAECREIVIYRNRKFVVIDKEKFEKKALEIVEQF